MTYTLLAIFLLSGKEYPERTGLSLAQCAGYAAITRQETADLHKYIGEVRYRCVPEDKA